MTSSDPDYYWERIKDVHKFFFGSLAFLFVSAAVFGDGPVSGFAGLLFLLAIGVGPLAFIYYAYKDKQALAARYDDVNERHWLTIGVFMWFSSGFYAFVYAFLRATRYDPVNPSQTETGAQKLLTAGRSVVKQFGDDSAASDPMRRHTSESDSHTTSPSSGGSRPRSPSTTSSASSSSGGTGTTRSSRSSRSSSGGRSRSSAPSTSDSGSNTKLYVSDDDDGSGNTEVFDPAADANSASGGASSTASSSDGSTAPSEFCSYCGTDLRPHHSPKFCPECGTETA